MNYWNYFIKYYIQNIYSYLFELIENLKWIQTKQTYDIIPQKFQPSSQWWWWWWQLNTIVHLLEHVCARSVTSDSLWPHGLQPNSFLCPWDSLGKNTGVCSHSLLHGIFQTQGSNLRLLNWQADSLPLSHLGNPL